jgi:hypothetical protein
MRPSRRPRSISRLSPGDMGVECPRIHPWLHDAVFNLFESLLAGVIVFIGGYAFGRWITDADPAMPSAASAHLDGRDFLFRSVIASAELFTSGENTSLIVP